MAQTNASQHFVPIKDIRDGIVVLKNGQMCIVLLASSVNFAFKSSDEQQAILSQFQSFLNTLEFSLQIYVQSRRLDIRPYLAQLAEREPIQDNDLMRIQLREYINFIKEFTTKVDIMSKNFFVIIPYTPGGTEFHSLSDFLHSTTQNSSTQKEERFAENRTQLEQRVAIVEQGLARIGVRTVPLGNDELIELYYHIFNPEDMNNAPKL